MREENLSTRVTDEDLANAVADRYGVLYSKDGKRLLKCKQTEWNLFRMFLRCYSVRKETEVVCDGAFVEWGCRMLKKVLLPDSIKAIGEYAFRSCSQLRQVTVGSGVSLIGDYAFQDCSELRELDFNAAACTSVGLNRNIIVPVFEGCTALTKVNIGDNVTALPPHLFYGCSSLREVTIGQNVKEIGSEAFLDCTQLARIGIPAGVEEIGGGAFEGCGGLTAIDVAADNRHYCSAEGVLYTKDMTVLLRFPAGSPLKEFSVPESVTEIGEGAFSSCADLRKVTLPFGLKSIGDDCFLDSKKIKLQVTCPPNGNKSATKAKFEKMLAEQAVNTVKVMQEPVINE